MQVSQECLECGVVCTGVKALKEHLRVCREDVANTFSVKLSVQECQLSSLDGTSANTPENTSAHLGAGPAEVSCFVVVVEQGVCSSLSF